MSTKIKMTQEEVIFAVRELVDAYNNTCINCFNFDEEKEICKLCSLRPPAKVIARGCPQFDDIPF